MTDATGVPPDWWRRTCECIHHPVACVATDHTFIWVNSAFERMVGYSLSELRKKTWMQITYQQDVGGDMQSIVEVISGEIESYTISKRYEHKLGEIVPIILTVWRFPPNIGNVACFIVEAAPKTVTQNQLETVRAELLCAIRDSRKSSDDRSGVNVSVQGDHDNKSGSWTPAMMVGIAIAMAIMVMYLFYIMNGQPHHSPPPSLQVP